MIEQQLLNTNKSATVVETFSPRELNKALRIFSYETSMSKG
jgi:hypothetical protein